MGRRYLGGGGSALTVWISIAASTVLVFYGYDQGVFGNVIIGEDFLRTMGHPSTNMQSTMTSVYNLGCFAGAMSTVWTGDVFGRPRQILLGSTIIALGATIQAASYGVPQMMVGRVVAGVGTGMNTATAGVWQAETSKMRSRGKLVIIQMANCITGFSISNWLTLGFSFAKGSVAWRFPLAFQIFFSLMIWCLCPFLPDSPRLLIRKGKYDDALEVIAALEGNGATVTSPSVKAQFNIIKDILDREHMTTYTWWQLLTGRGPAGVLRRMILGAWIQSMNQLSGINITSYYMSYVFINALKINELLSRILAAAGSVDYLFFSCMAYFFIERYGRRRIFMCSAAACFLEWVFWNYEWAKAKEEEEEDDELKAKHRLYPTEINALEMRTKGSSLASAANWIMNYMVVQVTPPGIANLGWRFWIIWACICFSFIPIVYLFYPETANRTLEDIDRYFESNPGLVVAWDKGATQPHRPKQ
ncbi:hypothetical protein DTO217A2_3694 [Paecilomyces variotii]|nr:hypothetical protein DTO217A2_3694 [Paecilomyces variotii]